MGEPLGFAYVAKEKRLAVPRHSYRLSLIVGIQPENAGRILDDRSAGTPQRFLWLPADDLWASDIPRGNPGKWPNPLVKIGAFHDHHTRQEGVCETARREIDLSRLAQLRGTTSEALDGHALLAQLKVAAFFALLDGRRTMTTEDDWKLARAVRQVFDQTRQHVIDALERDKIKNHRVRAETEASRVILIGNRMTEAAVQRVGRAIMASWTPSKTGSLTPNCGARSRRKIAATSRTQSRRSRPADRLRNAEYKVGTEYRRPR
jgi:hypothetical protein